MGASLDVVRRWRWGEDLSDDQRIPDSWVENGQVEPCAEGEIRFYAIKTRIGRQFLWNVDSQTGSAMGIPVTDRVACEVLYVSRDGRQAVVRTWETEPEMSDGKVISARPTSDFHSVLSKPEEEADTVQDEIKHDSYRRAVEHFYAPE